MTGAIDFGKHWFSELVSGLPGKARLILLLALSVVALDHAAKLGAAWFEPAHYMHNPAPIDFDWVTLVPALALVFPSRVVSGSFAVLLGGATSNVLDVYLWPGGVPDFIPIGGWISNPADFAIFGGVFALIGWPVWKLFRVARRKYPESVPEPAEAGDQSVLLADGSPEQLLQIRRRPQCLS